MFAVNLVKSIHRIAVSTGQWRPSPCARQNTVFREIVASIALSISADHLSDSDSDSMNNDSGLCRNRHIPHENSVLCPPINLNSVFNIRSIHDAPNPAESLPAVGAASAPENPLHFTTIRESVICSTCQLSQFERGNGKCRRCHNSLGISYNSLGISYIEILLSTSRPSLDSQRPIAARLKVGRLIRRLRFQRGITQATLASITGIHRTYLSCAEHGQVMPSVAALMQILGALGVDKVLLRVRRSSI